jgi:predicted peptidase
MIRIFATVGLIILMFVENSSGQTPPHRIPIVFQTSEMQNVKITTMEYKENLSFDLYYPLDFETNSQYPAIIFVLGYADTTMENKHKAPKLKDWRQYVDWAKLVATAGIIGINYETLSPEQDIIDLLDFINMNWKSLNIDKERIGVWSCSGNAAIALETVRGPYRKYFDCAVFYYGLMISQNKKYQQEIKKLSSSYGFQLSKNDSIASLDPEIPLFFVKSGLDQIPNSNAAMMEVIKEANESNIPLTFINYSSGHHAFDGFDDNEESRRIIQKTLEFYKENLF